MRRARPNCATQKVCLIIDEDRFVTMRLGGEPSYLRLFQGDSWWGSSSQEHLVKRRFGCDGGSTLSLSKITLFHPSVFSGPGSVSGSDPGSAAFVSSPSFSVSVSVSTTGSGLFACGGAFALFGGGGGGAALFALGAKSSSLLFCSPSRKYSSKVMFDAAAVRGFLVVPLEGPGIVAD